jgi:hypothetical protein
MIDLKFFLEINEIREIPHENSSKEYFFLNDSIGIFSVDISFHTQNEFNYGF